MQLLLRRWLAFPAGMSPSSGALPRAVLSTARLPIADAITPATLAAVVDGLQATARLLYPYKTNSLSQSCFIKFAFFDYLF